MVLRPEENASRREFHRQRLNWTKLVPSQYLRASRQLFKFVDMRAESVENRRPVRQERVGEAGRCGYNRSRHPRARDHGVSADGSSERYGREPQTPATSLCRHSRRKRRPREIDLPHHLWRLVANMEWRTAEH